MNERFLSRLARAAPPAPCADRLCLLTGQSRWDASPLSPAQFGFLRDVGGDALEPLLRGFPFDGDDAATAPPEPLIAASGRNLRQALWARRERFARLVARVLQGVAQATDRRLAIVTGSCGLELLSAAWPHLSRPARLRVDVLSFGPTGRPRFGSDIRFLAVQGARDGWSRALHRGPPPSRIGCGHLDYWTDPEAHAVAAAFLHAPTP